MTRSQSPEMRVAVIFEIRDLLKGEAFKVIFKEKILNGSNSVTARFVLAIKSYADRNIKLKACYVIGCHRDKLKHYMVYGAQILQASLSRLSLSLASAYNFDVRTSDVRFSYLQSTKLLERHVFIMNPAPEFELDPTECLE